jgi:hypothetical protein
MITNVTMNQGVTVWLCVVHPKCGGSFDKTKEISRCEAQE